MTLGKLKTWTSSISKKTLGEDVDTANILKVMADVYFRLGRQQDGLPLLKRAIEIHEKVKKDTPENINILKRILAKTYYMLGRYQEAEPLYKQYLSFYKQANNPYQIVFAITEGLAENYHAQGKLKEEETVLKEAIAIQEKMPDDSPHKRTYLPGSLTMLGKVYRAQGRFNEAEEILKRSVDLIIASGNSDFLNFASGSRWELLDLYRDQKRGKESKLFSDSVKNKLGGHELPGCSKY